MGEAKALEGKKLVLHWRNEAVGAASIESQPFEWLVQGDSWQENQFVRARVINCYSRANDPRFLMARLHKILQHGGEVAMEEHYGSSDEAYEHPDFRRPVFKGTFQHYWPQWAFKRQVFYLDKNFIDENASPFQMGMAVANLRNVVRSYVAILVCWKPEGVEVPPERIDPQSAFKII